MSNRFEAMNSSLISTNRLLSENDILTSKYNMYKRNLITSGAISNSTANNTVKAQCNSMIKNECIPAVELLFQNDTPERDCDAQKISLIKKAYNDRLISLSNNFTQMICKIHNDELIGTMRDDDGNDYLISRLREIIDEHLYNEQEQLISRLTEENAELKFRLGQTQTSTSDTKNKQLEALLNDSYKNNQILSTDLANLKANLQNVQQGFELEIKKLNDEYMLRLTKANSETQKYKSEIASIKDNVSNCESQYQEMKEEYEENKLEMDRLQKVISVLEIDLNSSETKLKEKSMKMDQIQHELSNLQAQCFEATLKYKKYMDENKSLQTMVDKYEKERKDILDKYSSFSEDMQNSNNEKLQNCEKKHKEKYNSMKNLIAELKANISNLEDELKNEKNKTMNTKLQYSKLYSDMQDNVKELSAEWEKRVKNEQMECDKIISELEKKHTNERNTLMHEHSVEIENKNRELIKLRQTAELLANFEKEYIRITDHEEILNISFIEMRKKLDKELLIKTEELENELKRKLLQIEEDKKTEYEFLTENIRKNLKQLEKENSELKSSTLDLQNKLISEHNTNEKFESIIANLQKTIRNLNTDLDEKESIIQKLSVKSQNYEDTLKTFFNNNKNIQANMEMMLSKLNTAEKERDSLSKELEETNENFSKLKMKLKEQESLISQLSNENEFMANKCESLEANSQNYENSFNNIRNQLKEYIEENENLKKKNYEISTQFKNFIFEKETSTDLLVKLLKTKLSSIRSEISSVKSYYNNELTLIKKEHAKTLEAVLNKIKLFTLGFDKEVAIKGKMIEEAREKEYMAKLVEKDAERTLEIKKIEQKFEKHLLDQFRLNEKLERENKSLIEAQQDSRSNSKEMGYKLTEYEQENKNLLHQVNKLKVEIDVLNEMVEKHRMEKLNQTKMKNETDECGESAKRESIRRLQASLSSLMLIMVKMKKKYSQEILKLKTDVDNLNRAYENEISLIARNSQSNVEILERQLKDERDGHKKLRSEVENKESEFSSIQDNLDNLKEIYENKIKILNKKITTDDEAFKSMKNELQMKEEQLNNFSNLTQESKNQMKALKNQLELKSDEVFNFKKEYEKLISHKDKKILELQSIVNQSLYSYNSGVNNIKIANKLDDEVKVLMKRAKIDDISTNESTGGAKK